MFTIESNIINEIRILSNKSEDKLDHLTRTVNENSKEIAHLKGQLVWMTAILIGILGTLSAGVIKYLLN